MNSFPDPAELGFLAILFVFADDGAGGLDTVACSAFPATIEFSAEAGTTYYAMTGSLPETDRGGPAVITVLQPFASDLTVDGLAAYDPQTNEVTISGTVDCLTPAEFFMSASARQIDRQAPGLRLRRDVREPAVRRRDQLDAHPLR